MTTPSLDDTDVAPTNDVAATRPYDKLNVSSDAFWEQHVEDQDLTFRQLRERRPVSWQPPIETTLHPQQDDPGFWAVVRHADIVEVSKNTDVFVSGYGVMFDVLPPVFLQMAMSFLAIKSGAPSAHQPSICKSTSANALRKMAFMRCAFASMTRVNGRTPRSTSECAPRSEA